MADIDPHILRLVFENLGEKAIELISAICEDIKLEREACQIDDEEIEWRRRMA